MFFKKRKVKKEVILHSPLKGELIPLEEVPDPVFSEKMMGEGIGFNPTAGELFSPVKGVVTQIFPTKHAIGIETEEGLELLLHLGLETVELNGQGFNIEVEVGDNLDVNDRIGSFSLSIIEENGKKTTTVLAITNSADKLEEQTTLKQGDVEPGTEIVKLKLKVE